MGVSIREFARRDGCSDTLVRRAVKEKRLRLSADGTLDPRLVGSGWRKAHRTAAIDAEPEIPADLAAVADKVVLLEGRAPYSLVEAERIKANYLALIRQLQYDRESGAVVAVDDVVAAVASEYAVVRNNILGLPAKLAPRLALMRNAEEARALMDTEIGRVLEDLTLDGAAGGEPEQAIRERFAAAP